MADPAPTAGRSFRLLTVSHFYEGHGGGIERVAGQLNRQLRALGHDTVWAAAAGDALPEAATAQAVPLACANMIERLSGLPMPVPGAGALRRLWRAIGDCDAVIVHDALYLTSIAAMIAARRAGKPVVLIQHIAAIPFANPLLRGAMRLANRIVTRPMLAAADQAVFISETVRQAFATVPARRPPLLLFNGVDTGIFGRGGVAGRGRGRAELSVGAGERLALFVGRFVEKKGLAILHALALARPDIRFVLAGAGPIAPERWGLRNLRVERGRSGATLARLYQAADLLILPSVGEGYPLVVQEAMACGLPVLCGAETARADPAAARWLRGVEIALDRPARTAAALSAMLDADAPDEAARAAMAAYAAETYCWRTMAGRIAAIVTALRPPEIH